MNNTGTDSLILIRVAGLPAHWVEDLDSDGLAQLAETALQIAAATQFVQTAFDLALAALPDSPLRTLVYNARRSFFQKQKLPTPACYTALAAQNGIPEISQLLDNLDLYRTFQQQKSTAEQRVQQSLTANYTTLQAAAGQETLQRALLFASHDLLDRLPAFSAKPVADFTKKDRQTALSLLQYLTRAAAKTSPLSRFTTVHFWQWQNPPAPDFFDTPKIAVTPNVALLPVIYSILLREPAFYQALKIGLNPCITATSVQPGKAFEFLYFDGTAEALQTLDANPTVDLTVQILLENTRSLPFPALITALQSTIPAPEIALQALLFELIDLGLLYWELPEKGLTPSWCSGLYNFLGFLPAAPVLTDTAYLLQWLRTAARTLAFQPVAVAQHTQQEAVRQVHEYLERYGAAATPIPPEQIFFEDVAQEVTPQLPTEAIETLTQQLADCWKAKPTHRLPPFRSRLLAFARQHLEVGQGMPLLAFCRAFLVENDRLENTQVFKNEPFTGKIGALLQIFQDETGTWRAVVNALFPGGGKMMARWRSLTTVVSPQQTGIGFPWQGFSNANFQPLTFPDGLAVPDGRVGHLPGGRTVLLGDLEVVRTGDWLQLRDQTSGQIIILNDLGLEAPETRPPVMQILWQIGVPYVATAVILPEDVRWEAVAPHIIKRQRIEYQSLILSRATWEIGQEAWSQWLSTGERSGVSLRNILATCGVPRRFFGAFPAQKQRPQYFSTDSPVSLVLLEKTLRNGSGQFIITEMLPLPEQAIIAKNGQRAAEFVVEISVENAV